MAIHRPQEMSLFDGSIIRPAVVSAFAKLDPRDLVRNLVMFTTGVGCRLKRGE